MAVVRCPALGDILAPGAGKYPDGTAVAVAVRPEKIAFGTAPWPANRARGVVRESAFLGGATLYRVELAGGASVTVASPLRIAVGAETDLAWPAAAGVLVAE